MHMEITAQIQRLEAIFDELHDYLTESEGSDCEITIKALKGSLFCRALFCDLMNEKDE